MFKVTIAYSRFTDGRADGRTDGQKCYVGTQDHGEKNKNLTRCDGFTLSWHVLRGCTFIVMILIFSALGCLLCGHRLMMP